MEIDAYLERLRYRGSRAPSGATLRALHRAHLHTVPFENLDISLGVPITLGVAAFYDKIVRRRRGGFCYELNGLFAWLLQQLGYRVAQLSGRVFHDEEPGPEFDHMVLLVELDERWVADVGFGDSFLQPLRLVAGEQQDECYRLIESDSNWILQRRSPESDWTSQYDFSLTPRRIEEFAPMCDYQQTSPRSIFTRKSVCSIATAAGRITLSNGKLITTAGGRREERLVEDAFEYRALLATHFGVVLAADAPIESLLTTTRSVGVAMVPRLQSAVYVRDYTLCLRFADGRQGEIDLKNELCGEVFEPLRDLALFKSFKLNTELNTITWANGADFAPEYLYEALAGGAPGEATG